jgi:zinc transport system substrate-binding protein
LDLDVVKAFVPQLAEALAKLDPDEAATYRERGVALVDSLNALDNDARVELQSVTHVPFAILHPAFETFALRYGLNLVAVLETHPEVEALPQDLGDAVRELKHAGAKVIFVEPQLSARTAEALAVDLGAKTALLDPLGGSGSSGRETYLDLLRWNVHQLAENLR